MRLAAIEERVPDPAPAIGRQEHGFAEIEDRLQSDPGAAERRGKVLALMDQGRRRGRAH